MTGTAAAPRRYQASYYQRDWVLACRDATSFYSTPLAWDLSGRSTRSWWPKRWPS